MSVLKQEVWDDVAGMWCVLMELELASGDRYKCQFEHKKIVCDRCADWEEENG